MHSRTETAASQRAITKITVLFSDGRWCSRGVERQISALGCSGWLEGKFFMGGWCGMGADCPERLWVLSHWRFGIDKVMVDLMLQWQ